MFTVEEMNLMCIYNTNSKAALLSGIQDSLPDVYDTDLREIMENITVKLERMTDEEFAQISFSSDYEDEIDEQEE